MEIPDELPCVIHGIVENGDVVLIMGAGSIGKVAAWVSKTAKKLVAIG